MTAIVPQTFSQDLILPKLVAYFNALPPEQRTFRANDFPIFNVKVIRNGDGSLDLIVGNPDVVSPPKNYAGEATFLWIGPRNTPAVATTSSFFELSKYVNGGTAAASGAVTVRVETGTYAGQKPPEPIILPTPPGDYTYIATLSDAFGDGWAGNRLMFTIDGTSYDTTINGAFLEQVYIFTANAGVLVRAFFDGGGEYPEECFLKLQEVPTTDPLDLTDAVLVFDSDGEALPSNEFLVFEVPYTPPAVFGRVFSQIITSPEAEIGTDYGNHITVSTDRTRLFINQPHAGVVPGRVYAHDMNVDAYGINATPFSTIVSPNTSDTPYAFSSFGTNFSGYSVAASGGDNLYVYELEDDNIYHVKSTIEAPAGASGFGDWLVTLNSNADRIIVGAHDETVGGNNGAGAVYVFEDLVGDGSWTQAARLTAINPMLNGAFGAMIAGADRNGSYAITQVSRQGPSNDYPTLHCITDRNGSWEAIDLSSVMPLLSGYNSRYITAAAVNSSGIMALAYGSYTTSRLVIAGWDDFNNLTTLYQRDYPNQIISALSVQENTNNVVATITQDNVTTLDWFIQEFSAYTLRSTDVSVSSGANRIVFLNDNNFEVAIGYSGASGGQGLVEIAAYEEQ